MRSIKYRGPGLLESAYEKSLARELELIGIKHRKQVELSLKYKGVDVGDGLRLDLIVEGKVIVELKVVREFEPIHEAQLLTYMKLTGCNIGLLINFNNPPQKEGIRRFVL